MSNDSSDATDAMAEGVGELHLAIVVDCSPESLSEDVARGSFGRASTSTRLEALLDVARDYAVSSRASAATVLACDPSRGSRVTSKKNSIAIVVPPRRVTADEALFRDADRALGLVDDDGRRREVPAPPPGAPLHACLALAAMALRRCPRAASDPAERLAARPKHPPAAARAAPPTPRRRVLVLLASDPDPIAAAPLALAPALATLRASGARRDVLHVAPPPRPERLARGASSLAASPVVQPRDAATLAETLTCISDDDGACFARVNGASIGRARSNPAGALTFAAAATTTTTTTTTTTRPVGAEDPDPDRADDPAAPELARADERLRRGLFAADSRGRCRGQHGELDETVRAVERARGTTGRVESSEEATSGAWRIRVQVDVLELDDDETERARGVGEDGTARDGTARDGTPRDGTSAPPRDVPPPPARRGCSFRRVRRRRASVVVDPGDVPKALAALTHPIVEIRAGRLLARSVDPIARDDRVSLAPDPRTTGTGSRLRLRLRADGSLRLTHAHPRSDPPREETLANVSADRAARFRAAAAADRDATATGRAAPVDRSGRSEVRARLPGDASRRAFFLTLGSGAGKRRFYFWSQEPNLLESESALKRLESALRDPPTLADASGVPPERLHALAAAAPALASAFADARATRDKDAARTATALANARAPTRTFENPFETTSNGFGHMHMRTRMPAAATTTTTTTTTTGGRREATGGAAAASGAAANVQSSVARERRRVDANRPPIRERHAERNDDTSPPACLARVSSSPTRAWVPPRAPAGSRVTSSNVALFFARQRENAALGGGDGAGDAAEDDDEDRARGE